MTTTEGRPPDDGASSRDDTRGTGARSRGREREPGYRGSLPPRTDRLARPWVLAIIGIFVAIIVLSILAVPSRFLPDPTPVPVPSISAAPSATSGSADPSATADPSGSVDASGSASPPTSTGASDRPSGSPAASAAP